MHFFQNCILGVDSKKKQQEKEESNNEQLLLEQREKELTILQVQLQQLEKTLLSREVAVEKRETQVKQLEASTKTLIEETLTSKEIELKKRETQVQQQEVSTKTLQETLKGVEQTLTAQREELESVKTSLEERSDGLSKLEGEFEKRVTMVKQERIELKEKMRALMKKKKRVDERENYLKIEREALDTLHATLKEKTASLESRFKDLEKMEKDFATRQKESNAPEQKQEPLKECSYEMQEEERKKQMMSEKLDLALSKTEKPMNIQSKEIICLEEQSKRETTRSEESMLKLSDATVTQSNERCNMPEEEKKDEPQPESSTVPTLLPKTQGDMKQLIDAELGKIIQMTEEKELEEPMETEVVMALREAAHNICYVKKHYDALKKEYVFFPSVAKTIMTHELLEEAKKHYYEENELPMEVSIALRSIAVALLDDTANEEYTMESMAANNAELPP